MWRDLVRQRCSGGPAPVVHWSSNQWRAQWPTPRDTFGLMKGRAHVQA